VTPHYPGATLVGWLVLALGSALLGAERERRIAGAGLLCLGLGLAAWRVSSAGTGGLPVSASQLGQGFLVVNGGLMLLGLGMLARAAATGAAGPTAVAGRAAIGLGIVLIAWVCAGLLMAGGPVRVAGSAAVLALAGIALVVLARAVRSSAAGRAAGRFFSAPLRLLPPAGRTAQAASASLVVGSAAAAAGGHTALVFLGVLAVVWSGYLLAHRDSRPLPVAGLLALVLVPTYWLLATIAGPVGMAVDAIPLVPLSPAAEWLVAAGLLLAVWSTAGLWPLHRQVPGALSGLAGALLLTRIAIPLAPAGLEDWQPVAFPLLTVGIWHGAMHARWPLLAAGSALLGLLSVTTQGASGAWWLLAAALALELRWMIRMPHGLSRLVAVGASVSATWGGLLVLEGGLRSEVVYTALGAAVLALVAASGRGRAMTASAPSTPAPSA
jgi:hypothetical protein